MHHKMIPGSFQKDLWSLEFVPGDFGSRFKVVFTLTYSPEQKVQKGILFYYPHWFFSKQKYWLL